MKDSSELTQVHTGSCTVCGRAPAKRRALSIREATANAADSWRRQILAICALCRRRVTMAGKQGGVLRARDGTLVAAASRRVAPRYVIQAG